MKVTFLGTGTSQGIPIISCSCDVCLSPDRRDKRLRTSVLVETKGVSMVIDSGPDFRHQMLRENVKSLDAILFTHEHRDHIAGLDDVRAFNFIHKKPMDIFAETRVLEAIKTLFLYAFAENSYPGVPKLNSFAIGIEQFEVNGVTVLPIRIMHNRLPILGFRIGGLTYITDASFISKEEKQKAINTKVLIINALRKEKHSTHFNLEEALGLIREIAPERAFITHISHQMGRYKDIQKELPDGVFLAYDCLSIEVDD